jgi:hypothetical protein
MTLEMLEEFAKFIQQQIDIEKRRIEIAQMMQDESLQVNVKKNIEWFGSPNGA